MFTKIALITVFTLVPVLSGTTDAPIQATNAVINIQPGTAAAGGTF